MQLANEVSNRPQSVVLLIPQIGYAPAQSLDPAPVFLANAFVVAETQPTLPGVFESIRGVPQSQLQTGDVVDRRGINRFGVV